MPRALRSTAKRLAQTLLGQEDVQGFVRIKRLWLSKQIYRRPIAVAELRRQLIDLGVTPGRTLWVQSSWNEFFNVAMRPSEVIHLELFSMATPHFMTILNLTGRAIAKILMTQIRLTLPL